MGPYECVLIGNTTLQLPRWLAGRLLPYNAIRMPQGTFYGFRVLGSYETAATYTGVRDVRHYDVYGHECHVKELGSWGVNPAEDGTQ